MKNFRLYSKVRIVKLTRVAKGKEEYFQRLVQMIGEYSAKYRRWSEVNGDDQGPGR
jgi:hypothetical protein